MKLAVTFFLLLFIWSNGIAQHSENNPAYYLNLAEKYKMNQVSDSALLLAQKGHDIAVRTKNDSLIKKGLLLLSDIYKQTGNNFKALQYCDKLIEASYRDSGYIAKAYVSKGIIYADIGDITKATSFFIKALKIRESRGEWILAAYIYSNLAGICGKFGDLKNSVEFNNEALNIFNKFNNQHGLGYVYNNMGQLYYEAGKKKDALSCFLHAEKYFKKLNDRQFLSFITNNIAEIFILFNKPDSAKIFIDQSIHFSSLINDKLSFCNALNTLGKFYKIKNDYIKSVSALEKSLSIAKDINWTAGIENSYKNLSDLYYEAGDKELAYKYLTLSYKVHDSVFKSETQRYVADAEARFKTEKKDKKLKDYEEKHKALSTSNNNKQYILIFVITGSASAIAAIFLYYRKKTFSFISKLKIYQQDRRKLKRFTGTAGFDFKVTSPNEEVTGKLLPDILPDIKELVEKNKIYLQPGLTEAGFAKMLKINTSYLSRVINEHYGCNYSNFINKYRVEEAMEMIRNNKQSVLTFEGIASSSGFKSKSAFNTAFKKFTGTTPSGYAASLNNKH